MHDLRASAAPGTFLDQGQLLELVESIPSADEVSDVTERLVVDSQLSTHTDDGEALVTARIVGGTLDTDAVDRVWVGDGARPEAGTGSAVLEAVRRLPQPAAGGNRRARRWTKRSVHRCRRGPEEFYISGPEGTVMAEADLATVYLHLADKQALIGRPDAVNDVADRRAGC